MTNIANLYKIEPDKIYTTYQVASLLQVGRWSVMKNIHNGELKSKKVGLGFKVLGSQVLDFLQREFK